MKKLIALLLAVVVISATACGNNSATKTADADKKVDTKSSQNENSSKNEDSNESPINDKIQGEITVSTNNPQEAKYLEEAVKSFNKKYPEVKVNIDSYNKPAERKSTTTQDGNTVDLIMQGDHRKNLDEYINKINTEMMSGKGADIYSMGDLPYYKYAANNQLEDLSKFMDKDKEFNIEEYRKNIIEGVKYNGGQYMLPLDYGFNYISYDEKLLNDMAKKIMEDKNAFSYDELADIGMESFKNQEGDPKKRAKLFNTKGSQSMFNNLFKQSYTEFVNMQDKTVDFNEKFINRLKQSKKYEQEGYIDKKLDMSDPNAIIAKIMNNELSKCLFQSNFHDTLLNAYAGDQQVGVKVMGLTDDKDHKPAGLLKNSKGEITYDVNQCYAINSNSKNKSTAWAFIKFLLDEKIQTSSELTGLPVNNKAFNEKAKLKITGDLYKNDRTNDVTELNEEQQKIYDKFVHKLNEYSSMLNKYQIKDNMIDKMINTEVDKYFEEGKDANEVTKNIQNKVSLYLNE